MGKVFPRTSREQLEEKGNNFVPKFFPRCPTKILFHWVSLGKKIPQEQSLQLS